MPRYIDVDALLTDEMTHTLHVGCGRSSGRVVVFVNDIEKAQTADAVPRAEVAMEIFEKIEKIRAKEILKCEYFRRKENDASERKYWEGGEHSLRQLSYWIAELKKKYTEGQI